MIRKINLNTSAFYCIFLVIVFLLVSCGTFDKDQNLQKENQEYQTKIRSALNRIKSGITALNGGNFDVARRDLGAGWDVLKRSSVLTPREKADILFALGISYEERGDFQKVEFYLKNSLQICEEFFGEDDLVTANTIKKLGSMYLNHGKYTEARHYLRRALQIHKRILGPDDPRLAGILLTLANTLNGQEKPEEAILYLKKAKNILGKTPNPDPLTMALTDINLGHSLALQGKLDESEKILKNNLPYFEKKFDYYHNYTAVMNYFMGFVHWKKGDLAKARLLYLRTIEIYEKIQPKGLKEDFFFVKKVKAELKELLKEKERL